MTTSELANEQFVSITTFKRDGTAVSTPVWVAGAEVLTVAGGTPDPGCACACSVPESPK